MIEPPIEAKRVLAAIIFVVSFIFICSTRIKWLPIGRPAAALIGSVCITSSFVVKMTSLLLDIDGVLWDCSS